MRFHHYLIAGLILVAGIAGCAADGPEASASMRDRVYEQSVGAAPAVRIVELKNGGELIAFGHYNQPGLHIIILAEPGQSPRLLYQHAQPVVIAPAGYAPVQPKQEK